MPEDAKAAETKLSGLSKRTKARSKLFKSFMKRLAHLLIHFSVERRQWKPIYRSPFPETEELFGSGPTSKYKVANIPFQMAKYE